MVRHLGHARILTVATLALLLAGALPAAAQDDVRTQLENALLVADDLPEGFASPDGIVTGSNFNLDQQAFDANNGLGILSQVWSRQSATGPFIVFDFRLLFPTPEDARNYLRDAEEVISERDASALKRDRDEPAIGDLHRLYAGSQTVSGVKVAFNNHLFTVGPMAAKVFVSGAPGSAPGARRIAEAAAAHMAAALPTPTQEPTIEPLPSTDPSATVAPGPDPSTIFEQLLIAQVGEGVDPATCAPVKDDAFVGELAGITCTIGDGGDALVVRQLDSPESLVIAFEPFKGDRNGPTGTCESEPALEPRLDGGVQVGQLACYDTEDPSRVFIWTDERFDQIAWVVVSQDRPFAELFALYQSAGPVALSDAPRRTPEPTSQPTTAPEPTPVPTTDPNATSAPLGTIPPGLTGAEAALAAHVPRAFVGTCRETTINVDAAASAALLCTATASGGDITVTYQQFDSLDDMNASYAKNVAFMGAPTGSGPCSGEWPAENTWSIDGQNAGRVACAEIGGFARNYAWTDERLLISGFAETFDVAKDDLHQWWLNESGPNP